MFLNFLYTKFEKRSFTKHNVFVIPEKNERDLVSDLEIVELLAKLEPREQVWLVLLVLSGRRQNDICKITKSAVTTSNDKTFVICEYATRGNYCPPAPRWLGSNKGHCFAISLTVIFEYR